MSIDLFQSSHSCLIIVEYWKQHKPPPVSEYTSHICIQWKNINQNMLSKIRTISSIYKRLLKIQKICSDKLNWSMAAQKYGKGQKESTQPTLIEIP